MTPQFVDTRCQILGHRVAGPVLVAVDNDEQRAVRQELIASEAVAIEFAGRQRAQRRPILQDALHPLEAISVGLGRILLSSPRQQPFDKPEIGQDALVRETVQVPEGVGDALDRRVLEIAQHERERLLLADRRERPCRQARALRPVLTGHVTEGHLRVGRLLRVEDAGEPVDALVGHAYGPEAHFATVADRHGEPGHRIEHRGLA